MDFGRQESWGRLVVGEIPEYLTCAVCLGLLDNASQGVCGHVFCRSCIEGIINNNATNNDCPLCRSRLFREAIGPNRIAQMLVDKLPVNCPVEDTETGEKCTWIGEKSMLPTHYRRGECTLLRRIIERTPVPEISHFLAPQGIGRQERRPDEDYVLVPSQLTAYSANHDVCGGGTGREFVRNLASADTQSWNKWFGGGNLTAATITITLAEPQCVHRYRLRSANDCHHRNPSSWELWGKVATSASYVLPRRAIETAGADAGADVGVGVGEGAAVSAFHIPDLFRYARRALSSSRIPNEASSTSTPNTAPLATSGETVSMSVFPTPTVPPPPPPPPPGSWVCLHTVPNGGPQFHSHWQWLTYDIDEPTADEFDAIQLRITGNQGGNGARGLQLGAFHLYTLTPFF